MPQPLDKCPREEFSPDRAAVASRGMGVGSGRSLAGQTPGTASGRHPGCLRPHGVVPPPQPEVVLGNAYASLVRRLPWSAS